MVIVLPLAAVLLKVAVPVPVVVPGITEPALEDNVKAPWVEAVRKGAPLPEMLVTETEELPVVYVAVTLGFGAVIYA